MKLFPVVALLATLAAGGCSNDPQADYCDAVEEHQAELTDLAAADDPAAIFGALDAYDDLREKAPRDIVDDWDSVVGPLRDLEQVLSDRGVDPSTYSAEDPPVGLTDDDRKEIEASARAVGAQRTVEAMAAVEQHALDVCGTPLSR
ncbi:MAG TPA: hypothetical protein VFR45_01845 [Nocardioides sp.]|nr:hypothetical protein [Nocardioides sp.]